MWGHVMGRRTRAWHILQGSKAEALLAVDHYNTTGEQRSFEAFVVHMHLAWLYLLLAEFKRPGQTVDTRHWTESKPRRLIRVDGEPKTWELAKCVAVRWPNASDPVRLNLEFFVGLRNKIEHRYQERIGVAVSGHSQALIINYERELVEAFGTEESLAAQLRFPVFLSSLTPEGMDAIKRVRARLPANATRYLVDFYGDLDEAIAKDPRFEFRINLVPQLGPRASADLAIKFVSADNLTADQREVVASFNSGIIATKIKHQPVKNLGLMRPKKAQEAVQAAVGKFSMPDFTNAWKREGIRPPNGAPDPAATDAKYCAWDEASEIYVYTEAWVRHLIKQRQLGDK